MVTTATSTTPSTKYRTRCATTTDMVKEVIHQKLEIPTEAATISVADLGCAVGPNTFHSIQTVVDAMNAKIKRSSSHQVGAFEFQVFFNDQIGNDFNTLFESLPPNRQYFVAAVPGSFYSRLFPPNSIHYFNSSLALHWLSRAPSGLVNKGRVHCHGGGAEAVAAYGVQFRADIAAFLEARAVELVRGGLLVMLFVCRHEWMEPDAPRYDMWFAHIESILRELVAEGEAREEDLDSFQLPIYSPTVGEFREVVEINGSYAIHVAEKVDEGWASNGVGKEQEDRRKPDLDELARDMSRATRAVFEDIVGDHFGKDVAGEVFRRLPETVYQFFLAQPTMPTLPPTAFFVLQKKC
ncbi:farnesoic acid carboxyl-O-methyltransferase-like isoform X2 [Nymphaea colorata]|uniref:farnesoic acid carboxyl-O-methyltransferase-like isoform X2 n=1 Tax=Nymphaea colorata TaxID=210225 RepID=UPI00129D6D78|nr:farnesoic acid carboxyl-O-methyltransferase-like isoform X2 [Nymphaea colorata]